MTLFYVLMLIMFVSAPWKAQAEQMIDTVAGNGEPGYSGDGGAATEASLNTPWV